MRIIAGVVGIAIRAPVELRNLEIPPHTRDERRSPVWQEDERHSEQEGKTMPIVQKRP